MKKNIILFSLPLFMCMSCLAESNNLSPLGNNFSDKDFSDFEDTIEQTEKNFTKNIYASEIAQLASSFPTTSNQSFNEKIALLKDQIRHYLEVNNKPHLEVNARNTVIETYKKIQKSLNKLPEEEKEIVKIHLVKIKTKISKLKGLSS